MAYEIWQPVKIAMCDRIGEEVEIQARVVFPADILPDQPPRIMAKRCSRGVDCNLLDRPSCEWAGTLPGFNPLEA